MKFFPIKQVRQLQEELRKRHLYFGDSPDGEFSPALTAATRATKKRRGSAVTGVVESGDTGLRFGLPESAPQVAPTPFVVMKPGDVRDGNGELLCLELDAAFFFSFLSEQRVSGCGTRGRACPNGSRQSRMCNHHPKPGRNAMGP